MFIYFPLIVFFSDFECVQRILGVGVHEILDESFKISQMKDTK